MGATKRNNFGQRPTVYVYTVGEGLSEGEINILHARVTKKRWIIVGRDDVISKIKNGVAV